MLMTKYEASEKVDLKIIEAIIDTVKSVEETLTDSSPIISRIKAVIEENVGEDFAIGNVADEIGISRYYMAHVFKKHTGTTVTDYRNELRLARAKTLLISTDRKISDIATDCGFSSSCYFSEIFKKAEGISPETYRNFHR